MSKFVSSMLGSNFLLPLLFFTWRFALLSSIWDALQLTAKIYAACSPCRRTAGCSGSRFVWNCTCAPVSGVDMPAVLQSPSASLNKITACTTCDELLPFLQLTATLLSAKHLTSARQQLNPTPHPDQLAEYKKKQTHTHTYILLNCPIL